MIDLIATVVAIASLVTTGGSLAYMLLMKSAATKRGASGAAISADVSQRMKKVLVALAGSVIALFMTYGGTGMDIASILVAAGSAALAGNSLAALRGDYK